jgi:hypothetical protein
MRSLYKILLRADPLLSVFLARGPRSLVAHIALLNKSKSDWLRVELNAQRSLVGRDNAHPEQQTPRAGEYVNPAALMSVPTVTQMRTAFAFGPQDSSVQHNRTELPVTLCASCSSEYKSSAVASKQFALSERCVCSQHVNSTQVTRERALKEVPWGSATIRLRYTPKLLD